ncbi:hypothetical protein WOLCODRAFT_160868 [Wolfiporia cocos MD-104 SS10]|uniref:Uncharacterized protein n=1 Tax=Wolfiporia cocos (strain MD-104) TaxID=742152 RepID=A0A2H3J9U9_WOLCO|nr:hypothetical protein WOLCODRAFT_160868 [Wolfiporia cocos MD-104 SS10]
MPPPYQYPMPPEYAACRPSYPPPNGAPASLADDNPSEKTEERESDAEMDPGRVAPSEQPCAEKAAPADGEDSDRKAAEAMKAVIEANRPGPAPAALASQAEIEKEQEQEQAPTSAPQTSQMLQPLPPELLTLIWTSTRMRTARPNRRVETPKDEAEEQKPPAGGERSDILMEDGVTMLNPGTHRVLLCVQSGLTDGKHECAPMELLTQVSGDPDPRPRAARVDPYALFAGTTGIAAAMTVARFLAS